MQLTPQHAFADHVLKADVLDIEELFLPVYY